MLPVVCLTIPCRADDGVLAIRQAQGLMPYHAVIPAIRRPAAAAFALLAIAAPLRAQTDYYNTDAGRPIAIEDAYPIERRALELQVAPLRLERVGGGAYQWAIEPEIAIGLLRRTQLEIGVPLAYLDRRAGRSAGAAGAEISVLHNLNAETAIPALGVAASVLVPAGPLGPERTYPSLKALLTRTFAWARLHLNAEYTFGDEAGRDATSQRELTRWMAGAAIDRTFPLESFLLTAEAIALQPIIENEPVAWQSAAGIRYQLSPRVATDAGFGIRLTGDDHGWFATFGAAVAVGLPWSPRR